MRLLAWAPASMASFTLTAAAVASAGWLSTAEPPLRFIHPSSAKTAASSAAAEENQEEEDDDDDDEV